jgi:hypothetical protein
MDRLTLNVVSLLVGGWIATARMMIHDTVKCRECNGTGAQCPDCETCHGERDVKVKRLYALGWKKGDLIDIDDDGYARCPSYGCEGDTCGFCEGEGEVPFHESIQQERRALIYAKYQRFAPLCTIDYYGRRRRERQLLSIEAAAPLLESHKAFRSTALCFGDSFYLMNDADFPELWREARARSAAARSAHYAKGTA